MAATHTGTRQVAGGTAGEGGRGAPLRERRKKVWGQGDAPQERDTVLALTRVREQGEHLTLRTPHAPASSPKTGMTSTDPQVAMSTE